MDNEPQLNVPIESLPAETRQLFDARHPIPAGVWFYPRPIELFMFNVIILGGLVGGAFGGSGIFGLIVMTVSILNGYIGTEPGDIVVYLVVYLVLAGLVLIAWREFWRPLWDDWLALQEKQAGKLRRGIFLTQDTLILRVHTDQCDIIPRYAIATIDLRGTRGRTWYMVYQNAGGKRKGYSLANLIAKYDLGTAQRIRDWAGI